MATISLGTVAFTYKGDYDASETYNEQDVVSFDGSSYVCSVDNTSGVAPVTQSTIVENQLPLPPTKNIGLVLSIENDQFKLEKQDVTIDENGVPSFTGAKTSFVSAGDQLDLQWGYTYWIDTSSGTLFDTTNFDRFNISFRENAEQDGDDGVEFTEGYSTFSLPGQTGAYTKFAVPYSFGENTGTLYGATITASNGTTSFDRDYGGFADKKNPDEYVVNYNVTIEEEVSDVTNKVFAIDGVRRKTLNLIRGYEYVFDQTDSTNTDPTDDVRIKFYYDNTDENSELDNRYSSGQSHDSGDNEGVTRFLVPLDAPEEMLYKADIDGGLIFVSGARSTTLTPAEEWGAFGQGIKNIASNVGDIIYFDGTQLKALPVGTPNTVLTVSNDGLPEWSHHRISSSYKALRFPEQTNTNLYRRGTVMMQDGTIRWWGRGANYMFGIGNETSDRSFPVQTAMYKNAPKFKSYVTDYDEGCMAIDENDEIWFWGYQTDGEAGYGNTAAGNSKTPRYISGYTENSIHGKRIAKIYRGTGTYTDNEIIVLRDTENNLHVSGYDGHGQMAGLTRDGFFKQVTGITEQVTDVAIGRRNQAHILALTVDGEVYSWGHNQYGQLGQTTSGTGVFSTPTKIQYFIDNSITITKIFAFGESSFAIDDAGNMYSWGYNGIGNLGRNGTTTNAATYVPAQCLTGVRDVFARGQLGDYENTFAIKEDGTLFSTGDNSYGSLGVAGDETDRSTFTQCMKQDYLRGVNTGGAEDPEPITDIVKVMVGGTGSYNRSYAMDTSGRVWACGYGGNGGLGTGSTSNTNYYFREIPLHGKVVSDFLPVGTSSEGGCMFLCTDGSVYQTGYAGESQLPEDDDEYISVPMPIRFA